MSRLRVARLFYKAIWGKVVISNLQLDTISAWKYQEHLGGRLLKDYCLIFFDGILHRNIWNPD